MMRLVFIQKEKSDKKVIESKHLGNDTIFKKYNVFENDIIRIIKLAGDIYHIEIIPKDMQEYKLWSKICNQKFKSTTRKYGMM